MLPGYSYRYGAVLELGGLIKHHDRPRVTQMRHDEPLQRRQRRPVPGVLGQERLHPPQRSVPGRFGQLPARLAVPGLGQPAAPDVRQRRQPRPSLREQAAQLTVRFLQPCPVFYDDPGGHLIVLSCHEA
jgi:hypothetical protein